MARQSRVEAAQTLFSAGTRAFSDRSYGEAMDYFKAAFETMPSVPAVADQRRIFFRRYQSASLVYAQVKIEEARWVEAEATLAEVISTAEEHSIPAVLIDPEIRRMHRELLEHDDRYNRAASPQHLERVEEVRSKLILANGYLELGDYDRAERSYHQVLAVDRYNVAARRGLERVERHRMDYYDAAYDHTRARKIAEVKAGWETPVPVLGLGATGPLAIGEVAMGGSISIEHKLNRIIIPSMEFSSARLADVLEFLSQKSQELDTDATDPLDRGISIVIDPSGDPGTVPPGERTLSVRLTNIPLGEAIRYATQQVNMRYRIDAVAVTVVPMSVDVGAAMMSRSFNVPPGFISANQPDAPGAAVNDPFADPTPQRSGIQVSRVSARQFLENSGILFGEGASAQFFPATSTLLVRNTAEQLMAVEDLIQSSRIAGSKNVLVGIKMISVGSTELREKGLDILLGQFNIGNNPSNSPRVFAGGGTQGNTSVPMATADFPFSFGGLPVGMHPITSGLRMGSLSATQSIQDIINRDSPGTTGFRSPGVFAISGVFTDPQYQVVLRALDQLKGTDLLADQHVVVRPGQVARIEQVREFIYPTEYDPPEIPNDFGRLQVGNVIIIGPPPLTFPATPATPTAFETRNLGQTIEVEPTVAGDNLTVNLNVVLDFSDFVGFINYGTPIRNSNFVGADGQPSVITENRILMPVFDAIKETTNVNVWDGQTIAIGGLHGEAITSAQDKIPMLGDLPLVGRAFRSSRHESAKQAMLIFVTVKLVDPGGNPINAPPDDPELPGAEGIRSLTMPGGAPFAPGTPLPASYAK